MKKIISILLLLISINVYSYTAYDILDFLSCYNQPTHVVTGEPLYCDSWDLNDDDDVDVDDLLILLEGFGE